jgi:hypothetical protein
MIIKTTGKTVELQEINESNVNHNILIKKVIYEK